MFLELFKLARNLHGCPLNRYLKNLFFKDKKNAPRFSMRHFLWVKVDVG